MSKNTKTLTAGRPSAGKTPVSLTSLADEAEMKRVNFQLTAVEHVKLKMYAAKTGKSIKKILSEYIASLPD